jgi:hypothetical protein
MIVACVALVVALGGVSYAAVALPKNSVGTTQLKKHAVTAAKIKKNAVNSAKLKDGSLLAADFKAGQLPAGPKGDKGDKGNQGNTGARGEAGPPGPTFGATTAGQTYAVTGTDCNTTTLRELTLTVTKPSQIFASGYGAFDREASQMRGGRLRIVLLNGSGTTTLAALQPAIGTDENTSSSEIPITNDGVLFAADKSGVANDTPFVAQPGTYKLRLQGWATDSITHFCGGNGTWAFSTPQVSYILLGTSA